MILQPGLSQKQLIAKQINEDLAKLSTEERAKVYEGTLPEDGSIELSHFEAIPGAPTDEVSNDTVTPNTSVVVSFTPQGGEKVKIKFSYRRLNLQEIIKRKGLKTDDTDPSTLTEENSIESLFYDGEVKVTDLSTWGNDIHQKLLEKLTLPTGEEILPKNGAVPSVNEDYSYLKVAFESNQDNKTTVGEGVVLSKIRKPEHGICIINKDISPASTEEILNNVSFFKDAETVKAIKEVHPSTEFQKIILPKNTNGVIPNEIFKEFRAVASAEITIPNEVRKIGNEAFADTGIDVKGFLEQNSSNLTSIGDRAFAGSVTDTIVLEANINKVGENALGSVTTVKTKASDPETIINQFAKLPGGSNAKYVVEATHDLGEVEWSSGYEEEITHTKVVYADSRSPIYLTASEVDNGGNGYNYGPDFYANIKELYLAPSDSHRDSFHTMTLDKLDLYTAKENNRPGDFSPVVDSAYRNSVIDELVIGDRRDISERAFAGSTIEVVRVKTQADRAFWTTETRQITFTTNNLTKVPIFLLMEEELPPKELTGTGFLYDTQE